MLRLRAAGNVGLRLLLGLLDAELPLQRLYAMRRVVGRLLLGAPMLGVDLLPMAVVLLSVSAGLAANWSP